MAAFSLATLNHITTAMHIACQSNSAYPSNFSPYSSPLSPQLMRFGFRSSFVSSCVVAKQLTGKAVVSALQQPDSLGYGRKYVPRNLMSALRELKSTFNAITTDHEFQKELNRIMMNYSCRDSSLYLAEQLTERYKRPNGEGPEIYVKGDDQRWMGLNKINNAVAQTLLAKKLGKKRIIAETGVGKHGVATAILCRQYGLQCIIYTSDEDMDREFGNVYRMLFLGAEVRPVYCSDEISEAVRDWATNVETTHFILGSVAGPPPYPMMVREFHAAMGKATRKQAMEILGGKPDVLVACVGDGSNAMGLFREFVQDKEVRLIGVDPEGFGLDSGKLAATLRKREARVLQEVLNNMLSNTDGQLIKPLSSSVGLEYSLELEHCFLKDLGRGEYYRVTDEEALEAFKRLTLQGLPTSLETSRAAAYLEKLCPTLANGTKVVLFLGDRGGDKDYYTIEKHSQV